jgi:hypothetical protein
MKNQKEKEKNRMNESKNKLMNERWEETKKEKENN